MPRRVLVLSDNAFVMLCYEYGTWPLVIATVASLIGLLIGLRSPEARRWRRVFSYVVLCALIGPLFVVNTGLKSYWGRTRPYQVEEFGGEREYRAMYDPGPESLGHSFPSGHAAAGFFWTLLYFLLRGERPRLARLGLVAGLAAGALLGAGRIVQGRHYLSDILWSAALMFVVNLLVYRWLMPLGPVSRSAGSARPNPQPAP